MARITNSAYLRAEGFRLRYTAFGIRHSASVGRYDMHMIINKKIT